MNFPKITQTSDPGLDVAIFLLTLESQSFVVDFNGTRHTGSDPVSKFPLDTALFPGTGRIKHHRSFPDACGFFLLHAGDPGNKKPQRYRVLPRWSMEQIEGSEPASRTKTFSEVHCYMIEQSQVSKSKQQ